MDLDNALKAFAVRLYDWSTQDLFRELESGCPILSLIGRHNRGVGAFVSWSRTLSAQEHAQLATAMPRLFHENARTIRGEVISEETRRWGEAFYEQTTTHMAIIPPLLTAVRNVHSNCPVGMDDLFDPLVSSLPTSLGIARRRDNEVSCVRWINDWKVVTEFSYAPKESNLLFQYQFIRKDGVPIVEAGHGSFPRSLLAFYGIYPHTVVVVPSQEDCVPMARAMVTLAEHFVSQADPLFVGLGIDD